MTGRGREIDLATKSWLRLGVRTRDPVPPAPPPPPLEEARLALLSTGGAVLPGHEPFHTGKTGDPTFREIPVEVDPRTLEWSHPHYDTGLAREDPDCVFPLRLLRVLVSEGTLGSLAPTACSMMGYAPLTRPLVEDTAPAVGELMQGEAADAALLCPA